MAKAPDAFRTISEVAEQLETPAHVLRFWESKFTQVKPVKRAGGRRYYRPDDVALLGGIKALLHEQGMTIKGAQKVLRDRGTRAVMELHRTAGPEATPGPVIEHDAIAPPPADDAAAPERTPPASAPPPQEAGADVPAPSSEAGDEPAGPADNIVPLARPAATVDGDAAKMLQDPAVPHDIEAPAAAADLPPQPAPRPITGSRLLGTLARVDRAALGGHAAEIRPLVDRLDRLHARLTRP